MCVYTEEVVSFCLPPLVVLVVSESGFVEPPEPVFAMLSLAEDKTRLPCRYVVEAGEKVVQVTWYKELSDGSKEQIITAHFSEGHTGRAAAARKPGFLSGRQLIKGDILYPQV